MVTSGLTVFNPDVATLIEEAYERAGIEGRSGYELRSAIRSLNFLFAEWASIGFNLWTVDSGTISLVAGTSQYNLPTDTVDLIETSVRIGTINDIRIERIGVNSWNGINNKTTTGRPSQVYVERITAPRINVWPVPDQSYTFVYWRMRRIQDAGTPELTADVPFRFLPALVSGLAFHLHSKKSVIDPNRLQLLKARYSEDLANATYEDRERNSMFIKPRIK